jgi:hypothetical protein
LQSCTLSEVNPDSAAQAALLLPRDAASLKSMSAPPTAA